MLKLNKIFTNVFASTITIYNQVMYVGWWSGIKKMETILNAFNYVHCGVEILSTSIRIMEQVKALAEGEGLDIWYQDTDSMHINYEEIEILAAAFKKTW